MYGVFFGMRVKFDIEIGNEMIFLRYSDVIGKILFCS